MPTRQPPRNSAPLRQNNLRRAIAAAAARLIAEEGVEDYAFAKRKAARQMGISEGEYLPTNAEIEEALQEHLAIYQDDEHDERLFALRSAAVEAMHLLHPFRPYLTGTVLNGTAGAFSCVELEIYADSAKDVEIHLLSHGLRYEHREVRKSGFDAPEAILEFDCDGAPVRLSIYDHLAERSARRPTPGGTSERARIEAVQALLVEAR
ncbi:hypothetical protein [Uliginosibacterium sediminicola]|uniref:Nucleotidyltransferase n=1 Tax=Uliginosibacterium sediminicola TaxID=2024550 RepID=A0ABU9YX03_9RHOO